MEPLSLALDAACIGRELSLFYVKPGQVAATSTFRLCRDCKVADLCLSEAMSIEEGPSHRFGIWGGLTPRQRTRVAHTPRETLAAEVAAMRERNLTSPRYEQPEHPYRLRVHLVGGDVAACGVRAQVATDDVEEVTCGGCLRSLAARHRSG